MKSDFSQMKERAFRMLARRDHSVQEIKSKLKQKGVFNPDHFEALINHLKELGYLPQENELAGRWIKQWRSEGRGRHWIEGKLKTKGLGTSDLTDDEEEKKAAALFFSKKLRGQELSALAFEDKMKIARAMKARGFSHSLIQKLLRQVDCTET